MAEQSNPFAGQGGRFILTPAGTLERDGPAPEPPEFPVPPPPPATTETEE